MKVKIRGLVFAGFAAAVFAQSALAVGADDKTVTSKTYVDSYAQAKADRVLTKPDANSDDWNSTAKYPSMKVLGDKVEEVSTALSNLRADEEYITLETVGTGTDDVHQEITVKSNNLATTAASITATGVASDGAPAAQDKLVTASAVNAYAEAKDNKLATDSNGETITAAATATSNDTSDTTYPTTKNVYEFVTGGDGTGFQRKLRSGENPSLGVYNADGTTVWREAQGGTYVNMNTSGTGAITFDVPQTQTARKGADDTTTQGDDNEIVAGSYKLATANAVYEFVTEQVNEAAGDFQPKISETFVSSLANINGGSDAGVGVPVGYRSYTNGEAGESTWLAFVAASNHVDTSNSSNNHLAYLAIQEETTDSKHKYTIDVKGTALAQDATAIGDAGVSGATYTATDKLTTAKAVYDYAAQKDWGTTNAGKHLVVGSDGKVTVSTNVNPDIPLPTNCATGNNVCALVAHYDSNNSAVVYEWTVMAGTGN